MSTHRINFKVFIALLLCCFCFSISAYAVSEVNYTVDMTDPGNHFFKVEIKIDSPEGDFTDLVMPRIIPGIYHYRDYAKNVQEFSAFDGSGAPLKWEKIDLHTWRVYSENAGSLTAKYKAYAPEVSCVESFLNTHKALINEGTILMYIKDRTDIPCRLCLKYPKGWKTATTLKSAGENIYTAPDYHFMADRPVMLGDFRETKFEYKGAEYVIVLDGSLKFDLDTFKADVEKIVKNEVDMMGGVPFKKYIFFYLHSYASQEGFGGLEHFDNAVMVVEPAFGIDGILGLTAHEFFHLWNDKNIHADVIYPFNYNKADFTRLYWFFEGFTSYYDTMVMARIKKTEPEEFFKDIAGAIKATEEIAANKHITLEDASFGGFFLWPQNFDEKFLNFYQKGKLAGLLMDLKIRHCTRNKRSIDDVMRYLYKNYGMKNIGVPEGKMGEIIVKATGVNIDDIINDYVKGTKIPNYNKYLNYAGLELKIEEKWPGPYMGIGAEEYGCGIIITKITRDSPAEKAGLSIDDVIVAVNGVKADKGGFLVNSKPYEIVKVTLFRNNVLMTKQVYLGKKGFEKYEIVELKNPDKLQREILKNWLGE
ncbi:MAG: PDZ domain-containing protein [Armatimonadota bacterium]